jgi:hypothetical protein
MFTYHSEKYLLMGINALEYFNNSHKPEEMAKGFSKLKSFF